VKSENQKATLLDFGLSFSLMKRYFDIFTRPRSFNILNDSIQLGLIPAPENDLANLYRVDLTSIENINVKTNKNKLIIKEIYLSHAHLDHLYNLKYLNRDIKVVCSIETNKMISYLQDFSSMGNDLLTYNSKILMDGQLGTQITRDFNIYNVEDFFPLAGGDFKCVMFYVDHSIIGSTAILLHEENTNKKIVYTGDFRLHGLNNQATIDFINFVSKNNPDVLIIEGTNLTKDNKDEFSNENQIYYKILEILSKNPNKFILFGCSENDIFRLNSFYRAASQSNRILVVDYKIRNLLQTFRSQININLMDLKVYLPRKVSGTYDEKDYIRTKPLRNYIRDPKYSNILIKAEEIKRNPEKYLLFIPRWQINELLDLQPSSDFIYIWSQSDPFDPEGEIAEEKFKAWIEKFNGTIEKVHCSGHILKNDLENSINKINPKILIPIHCEEPNEFMKLNLNPTIQIKIPKIGEEIKI